MSAKWVRSKQWEREHLVGALTPLRWLVHAFSTIWLAVILLGLVAVFGILASVPIGIIALIPTWLVYAATVIVALVLGAALPTWGVLGLARSAGWSFGARFVVGFVAAVALALATLWLWQHYAWPVLRYNRVSGEGLMFFPGFVDRYKDLTVRRLPGMEMSELEFYGWWPLKWVLLAFVVNMVVATVRRIEFVFVNIGVLTVHTGIVVIALGSVYYSAGKAEGDTILLAGEADATTGAPDPGPLVQGFFDNTRTVLRLRQSPARDGGANFEQRLLVGLPRYNDYNLSVLGGAAQPDGGRTLDIPVPAPFRPDGQNLIDTDIGIRVVGYAAYAEMRSTWRQAAPAEGEKPRPARFIELLSSVTPGQPAPADPTAPQRVIGSFPLFPEAPAGRWQSLSGALAVEYTRGMPEARWQELTANLPETAAHALIVEVPGQKLSRIYPVQPGQTIELGEPAWKLEVRSISPEPPFRIITPGYEGSSSSVAVVRVTPPAGSGTPFERYVYHRFAELNQDLLDEKQASGMPKRRAADSAIRIGYLDGSMLQVYIDEQPPASGGEPTVRAIVRAPGQLPRVIAGLGKSGVIPIAPMVSLRLGEAWANAERVSVPDSVPDADRTEREAIGTHRKAAVAVEVSLNKPGTPGWKRTVWTPFTQYFDFSSAGATPVPLPDGRVLEVSFGRLYIPFPDRMALQLKDFEMIPYPHSTQARDYRSDLIVHRLHQGRFVDSVHATSLNEPLKISPFIWDDQRSWPSNFAGWVGSKLGATQFKFSQAGWDSRGWTATKAEADAGRIRRPHAQFTILGVGNNPGIYIIAGGAIMMGVGTPWAFYVKPWLLRRRADRVKRELAAVGKIPVPGARAANNLNGGVPAERSQSAAGAGT